MNYWVRHTCFCWKLNLALIKVDWRWMFSFACHISLSGGGEHAEEGLEMDYQIQMGQNKNLGGRLSCQDQSTRRKVKSKWLHQGSGIYLRGPSLRCGCAGSRGSRTGTRLTGVSFTAEIARRTGLRWKIADSEQGSCWKQALLLQWEDRMRHASVGSDDVVQRKLQLGFLVLVTLLL